jgi:hypothetical protein
MAEGIRATPKIACTTSSLRNRSRCATAAGQHCRKQSQRYVEHRNLVG